MADESDPGTLKRPYITVFDLAGYCLCPCSCLSGLGIDPTSPVHIGNNNLCEDCNKGNHRIEEEDAGVPPLDLARAYEEIAAAIRKKFQTTQK